MQSRVECFRIARYTRATDDRRNTRRAEILMATPRQYGSKIVRYRAPTPRICDHHSFLHRPCVFSPDEPRNAEAAVAFTHCMIPVDRFTLGENCILRRLHGEMFTLEGQHQVRFLGRMCAIVVGHFRCPLNIPDSSSIKPFYLLSFEEPILENRIKLPRNAIFIGSREDEFRRGIFAEQLKRLYQSQVQGQNNAQRDRRVG